MIAPLRIRIAGTGLWLPPRVQTAAELAPLVGRDEAWIRDRTGVTERRISDESMAVMAARAGRLALGKGGPPDLVINASVTPIQLIPDSSVFILKELGYEGISGFSVHATCLSFLVALRQAAALVAVGAYRRVLVVSAEQGSVCRDLNEPESAVLIGDGAAAAVVEATPKDHNSALLGFMMETFPDGVHLAELRGCGTRRHPNNPETVSTDNLFHMNGPSIYRSALGRVRSQLKALLDSLDLSMADIDLVVPHQASGLALAALPRLGFESDRIVDVIAEYGNCIAASLPMALARADMDGRLSRGDRVLLLGTGAGLSVAGAVIRW